MGPLREAHISVYFRWPHQKRGPKGTPPEALHRTPEAMENSNTHTFGVARGAWASPGQGTHSRPPLFHPERSSAKVGPPGVLLFEAPFRRHLIAQPVPQTRAHVEALFLALEVLSPFQVFRDGWKGALRQGRQAAIQRHLLEALLRPSAQPARPFTRPLPGHSQASPGGAETH